MWADQMVELLATLNAIPAYFAGPSMGVRTNFAIAVRYPDVVRGLFMYLVSGNNLWPTLPKDYWASYADTADKGGMKAVAGAPYWTDLLTDTPGNRSKLLEMNAKEFSRIMRRWTDAYKQSDVALMMSEGDLRRHSANGVPTRLIAGCVEDNGHNRETSDRVAKFLPNAEYLDLPEFCAEWLKNQAANTEWTKKHNQPGAKWLPYYENSQLPGLIDEFITKTESKARTSA